MLIPAALISGQSGLEVPSRSSVDQSFCSHQTSLIWDQLWVAGAIPRLLLCRSNNVVLDSGDKYGLNEDGSELLIRDVKKVDEGDYTCLARNKAGQKAQEVSLNVFGELLCPGSDLRSALTLRSLPGRFLVPPQITYLKNQTASEFDELVTLTCEASGDPTPTIAWSFEDRVFTEGEQVGVVTAGRICFRVHIQDSLRPGTAAQSA